MPPELKETTPDDIESVVKPESNSKLLIFILSGLIVVLIAIIVWLLLAAKDETVQVLNTSSNGGAVASDDDHFHNEYGGHEVIHIDEVDEEHLNQNEAEGNYEIVDESLFIKEDGYGTAKITTDGVYRYIMSNGIPEHETGEFPNSGNPNSISEQDHEYRILVSPTYSNVITPSQINGVALNGIPLESGTAEFYNNDRSSGWIEEAFYKGVGGLGIDWSNAHVQPDGTYHYHALPEGLLKTALADQSGDMIHLAWASDGFPMYYSQSNKYSSSYKLKSGVRPNGPGGAYDGKYTQDYEYVSGLGDLDECNGIEINGQYVYLITNSFPFITRCVHGIPDDSFSKSGDQAPGQTTPPEQAGAPSGAQPPAEAMQACTSKASNSSCSFITPQGSMSGICRTPPDQAELICVP